jgi:peptide-methionine (S)-S-oxide reductase
VVLDLYFTDHDPRQLNRQGNDIGSSYRSAMFYQGEEQKEIFEKALERAGQMWDGEIVTTLQPLEIFWAAEEYHQDYFSKNPGNAYCQSVVSGKMAKTRASFTEYLK